MKWFTKLPGLILAAVISTGWFAPVSAGSIEGVVTNGWNITIVPLVGGSWAPGRTNLGAYYTQTILTNASELEIDRVASIRPTDFLTNRTVIWGIDIKAPTGTNSFSLTDWTAEVVGPDVYTGSTNILGGLKTFGDTDAYGSGIRGLRSDGSEITSATSLKVEANRIVFLVANKSFASNVTKEQVETYFAPFMPPSTFPGWSLTLKLRFRGALVAEYHLSAPLPALPRLHISKNSDGGFTISPGSAPGWPAETEFLLQTAASIQGPYNTGFPLKLSHAIAWSKPVDEGQLFFRLAYKP